jgi:NAD(P)H-dependent flavin oxidoreductase YrpB (nitropropane dioxygenase family)
MGKWLQAPFDGLVTEGMNAGGHVTATSDFL